MTKSLFTFVVFIAFLVGLIAPFSFLPPKKQNIDDPEPAVTTTKSKSKKKAPDVVLLPEEIEDPLHDYTLPNFAAIKNVNKKIPNTILYIPKDTKVNFSKNLRNNLMVIKATIKATTNGTKLFLLYPLDRSFL